MVYAKSFAQIYSDWSDQRDWVARLRYVKLIVKTRKNAIVECLDYQIPVTQLMGPKGNGDIQAAKRD